MHHWGTFLRWGTEHVGFLCMCKNIQYNHVGRMWPCSSLITKNIKLKIINTPLTLTLKTYQQSLYTQQLFTKLPTVVIDSKYIISMYNHLHWKASQFLNFWSTTVLIISTIYDTGLPRSNTLVRHFNVCRPIYYFLQYTAWLSQVSSSSYFSSISIT